MERSDATTLGTLDTLVHFRHFILRHFELIVFVPFWGLPDAFHYARGVLAGIGQ